MTILPLWRGPAVKKVSPDFYCARYDLAWNYAISFPEPTCLLVSSLGADQKARGLWERDWKLCAVEMRKTILVIDLNNETISCIKLNLLPKWCRYIYIFSVSEVVIVAEELSKSAIAFCPQNFLPMLCYIFSPISSDCTGFLDYLIKGNYQCTLTTRRKFKLH